MPERKKKKSSFIPYKKIYARAYAKGYEDANNENSKLLAGVVGAVGYGNGYDDKKRSENVQKKYESRRNY